MVERCYYRGICDYVVFGQIGRLKVERDFLETGGVAERRTAACRGRPSASVMHARVVLTCPPKHNPAVMRGPAIFDQFIAMCFNILNVLKLLRKSDKES